MLVTLVLSDVLGDPLDLIASGPTFPDDILAKTGARGAASIRSRSEVVESHLPRLRKRRLQRGVYRRQRAMDRTAQVNCRHATLVIGNNALAVDEAGIRAEQLGYNHVMQSSRSCEGAAEAVGRHLAEMTLTMLRADPKSHRNNCLITGGEPTVKLAPAEIRGQGGRNQQLVLAAYERLLQRGDRSIDFGRSSASSRGALTGKMGRPTPPGQFWMNRFIWRHCDNLLTPKCSCGATTPTTSLSRRGAYFGLDQLARMCVICELPSFRVSRSFVGNFRGRPSTVI